MDVAASPRGPDGRDWQERGLGMLLRVATFNVENLIARHRFGTTPRFETAAAMSLFDFPSKEHREAVERSVQQSGDRDIAVIPEGPYVVPVYQPA